MTDAEIISSLREHVRAIELRVDGFRQKFTNVKAETDSMLNSIKTHCREVDLLVRRERP